ncbi:hypothetical protein R1sor_016335 [Riccia sorocarpa]|uniref:Uncharacterized protein n=1 Tax=Riccia sorocarpa TaxID=122646 RepID=A0ABD3HIU3_9MARC
MIPAVFGHQANSPFSSPWIRNSSRTKSSCLDWRLEERYGVKESYRVRFSGSKLGRHFSMYSLNPEDSHTSSRVLGTEPKEGDEVLASDSDAEIQPNGFDSVVEVFQDTDVIDIPKGSTFEGDALGDEALGEQALCDSSNSALVGGEGPVGEAENGSEIDSAKSRKRDYCKRCCKAASRCICQMIETQDASQGSRVQEAN